MESPVFPLHNYVITLKEEGFPVFSQIRESLFPQKFSKDVIRESFFPQNFLKSRHLRIF